MTEPDTLPWLDRMVVEARRCARTGDPEPARVLEGDLRQLAADAPDDDPAAREYLAGLADTVALPPLRVVR